MVSYFYFLPDDFSPSVSFSSGGLRMDFLELLPRNPLQVSVPQRHAKASPGSQDLYRHYPNDELFFLLLSQVIFLPLLSAFQYTTLRLHIHKHHTTDSPHEVVIVAELRPGGDVLQCEYPYSDLVPNVPLFRTEHHQSNTQFEKSREKKIK